MTIPGRSPPPPTSQARWKFRRGHCRRRAQPRADAQELTSRGRGGAPLAQSVPLRAQMTLPQEVIRNKRDRLTLSHNDIAVVSRF
jgi:hypothetical protein